MSDVDNGKVSAWTDDAKFQFLLRVVAQFKDDGKQINWQKFEMPGRTTKSLQNMWTKVNKMIAELDEKSGGTEAAAHKKIATPRKRRAKNPPVKDEDTDIEAQTPKKTPQKIRSLDEIPRRTPKTRKALKDDDVSTTVLAEPGDDIMV